MNNVHSVLSGSIACVNVKLFDINVFKVYDAD